MTARQCSEDATTWWATATTMACINVLYLACIIVLCLGCVDAARRPRCHGGKKLSTTKKDMTFAKRLLTTSTLWLVRCLLVSRQSSCRSCIMNTQSGSTYHPHLSLPWEITTPPPLPFFDPARPLAPVLALRMYLSFHVLCVAHQACGGATMAYLSAVIYSAFRAWLFRGISSGYAPILVLLAMGGLYIM